MMIGDHSLTLATSIWGSSQYAVVCIILYCNVQGLTARCTVLYILHMVLYVNVHKALLYVGIFILHSSVRYIHKSPEGPIPERIEY
jgi:hypothetical protein